MLWSPGRCLAVLATATAVLAQSTESPASPTPSPTLSLSLTTSTGVASTATRTRNQQTVISSTFTTVFNVTYTVSATSTSSEATPTASQTPAPIVLETKLDPAFGVLGAILILTGLPSAFWGHKNRWTSFFLIGFYSLSLVCVVLILKFGVLPAVNPPSKTIRGMFVLASGIAGIGGGGVAIFFWKAARYFIGAWGGFALALWIQCFRNGGVIQPIGYRWILYIGCGVVGFILCTIPKIHYHVLLVSTAFVGASAFMLGVDCFTTAGLKEFYLWNLGFPSLFPKFTSNGIQFPVSQTMQIELGLIAAVALMGTAVQLRILGVLERKLKEIAQEQKKQDEEAELQAAGRYAHVLREREDWEKAHPTKLGKSDSGFSSAPLLKDQDGSSSPATPEYRASDLTLTNNHEGRARQHSGLSELMTAPAPEDDRRVSTRSQSPGALPTLDLGMGIEDDVPQSFMAKETARRDLIEQQRKHELVAEIETIRRSIDALKQETPPSSANASRHPSLNSRRTLSMDFNTAILPTQPHDRPPRQYDPRGRVHSMDLSTMAAQAAGESIGRPTSVPLQENWDAYVQERKLLQPPAGVTPPIATRTISQGPSSSSRIAMPPAVAEALTQRRRREGALGVGRDPSTDSSEDIPLSKLRPKRTNSIGGNVPVTILPPRKPTVAVVAPTPQRASTRTFEELNERHREKMRDLQAPLTTAEKEHADLEAARQRWERSKALEREAVTRRQAEKIAQLEKRKRSDDEDRHGRATDKPSGHSRSLSADKLGGSTSKRLSTMKVEDWRKHQGDAEPERGAGSGSKRGTKVPFPERRKSRDLLQ